MVLEPVRWSASSMCEPSTHLRYFIIFERFGAHSQTLHKNSHSPSENTSCCFQVVAYAWLRVCLSHTPPAAFNRENSPPTSSPKSVQIRSLITQPSSSASVSRSSGSSLSVASLSTTGSIDSARLRARSQLRDKRRAAGEERRDVICGGRGHWRANGRKIKP